MGEKSLPTGYLETLTAQQSACLEELKAELGETHVAETVANHPDGDRYLLRMLRATMKGKTGKRVFQVNKAKARTIAVLEWKEKLGLAPNEEPAKYHIYRKANPILLWKDYKAETVVLVNRMGEFASVVDVGRLTKEEWAQCIGYENEVVEQMLREMSEELGKEITGIISMSDIGGASLKAIYHLGFLKNMNNYSADNYPEVMQRLVLFNAPWIFPKIYTAAKAVLDPITLAKFEVHSKTPKSYFQETLEVEKLPKVGVQRTSQILRKLNELPQELGGTSDTVLPYPREANEQ